ncbi:MAG TPA: hypothetical protein VMM78_06085 [Thermomicrobiales bacterium]|nr:hypothetical protein [Thermomicrobiales bacterium]
MTVFAQFSATAASQGKPILAASYRAQSGRDGLCMDDSLRDAADDSLEIGSMLADNDSDESAGRHATERLTRKGNEKCNHQDIGAIWILDLTRFPPLDELLSAHPEPLLCLLLEQNPPLFSTYLMNRG